MFRRSVWWFFAVVLVVTALVPFARADAASTSSAPERPDDTLHDLENAFTALRRDNHARARKLLARAVARFDDLAVDATPLDVAFASDARKPYRGRAHERVLATTLLAALDIERGRCDLAIPTLRNAAFLDLRTKPGQPSDALLIHVLALRCIDRLPGAQASDRERVREDLRAALAQLKQEKRLDELVALAARPSLRLVLDGVGPSVVAQGAYGERTSIVAGTPGGARVTIALGGRADKRVDEGDEDGIEVWSSTTQATTVNGRPFEDVLAKRAQTKAQHEAEGAALWQRARDSARNSAPTSTLATALLASTSVAHTSLANATDVRADTRYVHALFERATLR